MRFFLTVPCFAFFLSATLAAQWAGDPAVNTEVVARPGDQATPKSAITPQGERWVAWFDNASGNYDVFAQCFDSQGHVLFPAGGILVSNQPQSTSLVNWDLIADSSGNAVLVFTDTRNGLDLDVYAYALTQDGTFLWGANGVTLSQNGDFEADPMVTETSTGDFVVVWSQFSSSAVIRMQRLNPNGQPQLAPGGVAIASEAGTAPGFAEVVAGNQGDVLVSWVRDTGFITTKKHLRLQAFHADATPAWPQPLNVFESFNLPIAYSPQLIADGQGGAVLCWHASNPSRGSLYESYVQHVSAQGVEVYPHNGMLVSTQPNHNHLNPHAAWNAQSGNIYCFWTEKDMNQVQSGWSAQCLDSSGRVWGNNGVTVLPLDNVSKYLSYVYPIGDGAMSVMTWTPSGVFGQDQVMATCLDSAGQSVWGGTRSLCDLPSGKSTRLAASIGTQGELVAFWEDGRNGDDDIYGQNIHADGTLGTNYLQVDIQTLSLFAGGSATLQLDAGKAFAGESYWVLGSNTGTTPGMQSHGLQLNLNNGPYFQFTLNQPQNAMFSFFRGVLDAQGRATAQVTFAPGSNPNYAGTTLHHACVVWGPTGPSFTTESEAFDLVP